MGGCKLGSNLVFWRHSDNIVSPERRIGADVQAVRAWRL